MKAPVLDSAHMKRLHVLQAHQGNSVRIFEELSAIFARDSHNYLQDLHKAVDACDEDQSRSILHALKGAALSVGAAQVAECCKQLEQAPAAPSVDAVRQLEKLSQAAHEALKASQTG